MDRPKRKSEWDQSCENEGGQEAFVAEVRVAFWRRKRWLLWAAGGLLATLLAVVVVWLVLLHQAEPILRDHIVEALEDSFHARVELDSFHVSLVNGLWAEGKGLRIWPPAQVEGILVPRPAKPLPGSSKSGAPAANPSGPNAPETNPPRMQAAESGTPEPVKPLLRIEEFRFHAPLHYQPGKPFHVALVELKGLEIDLPPKSHFNHVVASATDPDAKTPSTTATVKHKVGAAWFRFQVDSIECTGARLVLETSKPGKLPLEFAIARLKLSGIAAGHAMSFDAELTNPRPVGTIHTAGTFGPWKVADPGESPVAGDYRFDHADLASFNGIAGILNSTGHYQGTLRDLVVDGQTETPDFRLTHFGNAIPLSTHFHATVDATNGDTWLDPVDATLGHSHFTAKGQIVRVLQAVSGQPHNSGHDISLAVNVDRARIEDFLRLASHSPQPLLTGSVTMKTTLHIPPGPVPVHERLQLNGFFALDQARFTSSKIQNRIAEMSLRGQGRPQDLKTTDPASILSHMQGNFQLATGVLTLPTLDYTVPGAQIQLHGSYGLDGGTLDFTGTAKMQATVSQMVGGWKGKLLKPANRFFEKDGAGAEVPIHIEGTREEPKFGIDFERMRSRSPKQPGENSR
jgi:hypothetical protein